MIGWYKNKTMFTVGKLGKNLSPSKRRSCRIREYCHECASGWKILFHDKGMSVQTS
jgi:hypothetical protein